MAAVLSKIEGFSKPSSWAWKAKPAGTIVVSATSSAKVAAPPRPGAGR